MHITITGNLGSGKSTICKILEEKYGFEIYSTGKVQRELAREMNMTTLEMNQLMCSDRKYDSMIDDATSKISRENKDKNIIFDSRLAWNFVEESFKIFLSVHLDVAAQRVVNDNRGKEEQYASAAEAKEMLRARAATEDKRYRQMYNLEYFNFANYNLVIDSTYTSPEIIASIIMEEAAKYYQLMKSNSHTTKVRSNLILISPKSLYHEEITKEEAAHLVDKAKEYKEVKFYKNVSIPVKCEKDDYSILENDVEVKAAILAGIPFIQANIVG
ncbi:MAG: cytidylate kinase family protein [Anaerocolumna sp.]